MSKETTKGAQTPVKFEGETRGFCEGGQSTSTKCGTEQHGQKRNQGKVVKQDSPISKKIDASAADSLLDESKPAGTKRREMGSVEAVRRASNRNRDNRTVAGTHMPADIVIG